MIAEQAWNGLGVLAACITVLGAPGATTHELAPVTADLPAVERKYAATLLPAAADRQTRKPVEFNDGPAILKGTIFIPDGESQVPGVVIVGGSERGPRTRLKERLAEHFAGAGVAALIYDSAGTGQSTGNALLQTRQARAEEAVAAVRCLRRETRTRPDQVGILGISEGALVTMLAAARDQSVAFAIPVSGGFGVSMMELARYRIEVKGLIRGLKPGEIQRVLLLEEILFALMAGPDLFEWRLIDMKAAQWSDENWSELVDIVKAMRRASSPAERQEKWDALRRTLKIFRSEPWFDLVVVDVERFDRFMAMDAAHFYTFLEKGPLAVGDFDKVRQELDQYPKVRCPVLAVWGENDEFLPPHRSAAFLKTCLTRAGQKDATFQIVPNASHILTRGDDHGRFVDGFPDLLTDWLSQRFSPTPLGSPLGGATPDEDVDAILLKVRKAIGSDGQPTASKHHVLSGVQRAGGAVSPFTITYAPDGRFLQRYSGDEETVVGFDGTTLWMTDGGGTTRVLSLSERDAVLARTWIQTGSWLAEEAQPTIDLGHRETDGETTALSVTFKDAVSPCRIVIDRDTWLPRSASCSLAGVTVSWQLSAYVEQAGWKWPGRIVATAQSKILEESTIASVKEIPAVAPDSYVRHKSQPHDTHFNVTTSPELRVLRGPAGHRFVRPLVNGSDLGWFVFDTGSAVNVLAGNAADEIVTQESAGLAGIGAVLSLMAKRGRAQSLQLGPLTIDQPVFYGSKNPLRVNRQECAGIIGWPVFARCIVEYGAGGATISIHDPASYKLRNARWRDMTLFLGVPSVEMSFEGHTERFGIDTGFPDAVLFFVPAVERLRLLERRATEPKVHTRPWGGKIVARYGKIEWTDFEGIQRESIDAAFATERNELTGIPDVAGILGNELLEPYTVVFDYAHERIAFIPKKGKPAGSP